MAIRPIGDRVLVKPKKEEEVKKGSIYIPDTAKEKPQEGEIIEIGTGKILENGNRQEFEVKKGDKVLFGKYAGTEVRINDEDLLIMNENEILAIL